MEKALILLRGIPGSGKSTVAELLGGGNSTVVSADMFFEKDGQYNFDMTKLGQAHAWCKGVVEDSMKQGVAKIFVANTFTMDKEINPYINLAKEHDYSVVSLVVENRHGCMNIHGVPEESLKRMEDRFVLKLR